MQHFIDIALLHKKTLESLLERAQNLITTTSHSQKSSTYLQGKFIANLFFQPSTRTRCSFEIAAKKLGANVINLNLATSSINKGETEIDTVLNLQAMGVDGFVIRHQQNGLVGKMAEAIGKDSIIINAGCGTQQHPSQALLNMLTIRQYKKNFSNLTVAIIGDILHSRVAHSDIAALQLLGAREIRLIAPNNLLPPNINSVKTFDNIEEGLQDVDVIMTLRLAREYRAKNESLDEHVFFDAYQLNTERLKYAKNDVIIMHPGPINRGCEISDNVVNDPRCVILHQTQNGIFARMAILQNCFED